MWIVRLALKHTYTFVVMAMLIAVLGAVSIYRMSTDIFPSIDIPVVSVVWQYAGMPADEVETRIILINERVLTASVNDIEHIESQSLDGVGVIRIYFQPGAKVAESPWTESTVVHLLASTSLAYPTRKALWCPAVNGGSAGSGHPLAGPAVAIPTPGCAQRSARWPQQER